MSTANFSFPNTSKHYTIGCDADLEDWEYDDIKEAIQNDLSEIGCNDTDEWRDRYTHAIAYFDIEYYNRDYREWDSARLYVTIESGYYQGAMFDIDNSDMEGLELNKTTQKKLDRIWDKIEKILEAHTYPMVRVATFSNGEAIYEPANSKRSVIKSIVTGGM